MAYLDTIKAGAVSTWRTHQVLPSVVGAQAALESGWGTSKLAKPPYNNQFGIKSSADWTGRTVNMPTREYVSGAWVTINADFRAYDSAGESVKDHGAFFTSIPWRENNYKDVVGETDYKKACWALQNAPAPYATDTGYAQKLINLIENNNLQAWDREALADNSNTVATQTQQTVVSKMVGADLTDAGKQHVRDLNVTMIGDSLGVGTKPYFESLVPKANYDVLGSRQITHATNSLNGTYILQQMKNAGTLKEYVVVILGTNRGVTEQEVNNFASIAGDNHKVIFVDTASEVAHINTLSVYYQDAAKRLNNVYFANWRLKANSLKPQYYSKDGANGEYIHMTPLGYQKHAEFIAQALYEVATANFTDRVAEATKTEFYNIENFELNEDGLITYDAWKVNADGTSTKYKATKQTDIKGLYSPYGESNIYNQQANLQYGLGNSVNNSNWRETYFEDSEETDGLKLVEKASAELIERQEPEMIYTVNLLEIPVELSIGDTGIFVDHEFNPPLYIRARVLSITTSETNANLNKVTIGNVTELQPQDKSALMAIRAELQETRKDLESSWIGSISTDMTIVSTNGYVLGDRTRETSLVAKVFKGKDDITDQYEVFTWERISEDTAKDTAFNSALSETIQSSVLTVHEKDVIGNQSKFVARAFNATGELISHQEIVIKRVETALWTDTDTAPPYAIDGATWTKPDGTQWVLVDGVWEEKVNQAQMFTVKADIDAAKVIADNAKAEADDARQRAEDALTEAGISTDLAQTAKDLAQLAEDNAETALTNAQTAINEAGIAASQAVQAINTADTAKTNAQTALTNAQTALTEAGSAKTTANNLTVRVDDVEAEVELKASQTTVDGLSGTVTNHSTTLTQHANQIASKADSSLVNTIKGTVDTHTTEIAQNATEIASKASAISVNTLTGRVNTAETTITQHAGLIASKASQTEVDTVKGTVSSHTSTLSQHATEISARLTSTQVNSLVDGKGFATQTWANNQINATANGINATIDSVKQVALVNLIENGSLTENVNSWTNSYGTFGTHNSYGVSYTPEASGNRIYNSSHYLQNGLVYQVSFYIHASAILSEIEVGTLGSASNVTVPVYGVSSDENWKSITYKSDRDAPLSFIFKDTQAYRIGHVVITMPVGTTKEWSQTQIDISAGKIKTELNNLISQKATPQDIANAILNDKSIKDTRSVNQTPVWYQNNYAKQVVREIKTASVIGLTGTSLGILTTEISGESSATGSIKQTYVDSNGDTWVRRSTLMHGAWLSWERLVTNTLLTTTINAETGRVEQLITAVKTNPAVEIAGYNQVVNTVNSMQQTIGGGGSKIAQLVLTDSIFQTSVTNNLGANLITNGSLATSTGWSIINGTFGNSNAKGILVDTGSSTSARIYTGSYSFEDGVEYYISFEAHHASGDGEIEAGAFTDTNRPKVAIGRNADMRSRTIKYKAKGSSFFNIYFTKAGVYRIQNVFISKSPLAVATATQVIQLANNWAVRNLNSANEVVSQINLSGSTFLIEAKNIVGLGDAVINGKLTVTGDMIAGTISADKISGGTLTGTTFITTESATGFSTHIYNGAIEFKHQIFTLGHIHATVSSTTGAINGFAVVQRPGYIFSINSRSNLPNNNTSIAVLQVPADSTSESRKLNIFAQGGFRINSDTLNLENDKVIVKKPFQALDGFMASHEQSNEGAKIADAGNLIYSVDKAGSVMIHRFMVRRKDGTWPNNGLAIYEDGRVAVVVNGVWKQL